MSFGSQFQVVQIYISWAAGLPAPIRQLVAFKRLALASNQSAVVTAAIKPELMRLWMDDSTGFAIPSGPFDFLIFDTIFPILCIIMFLCIFAGTIKVYAGGQQPDQKVKVKSNILSSSFEVKSAKRYLNLSNRFNDNSVQ